MRKNNINLQCIDNCQADGGNKTDMIGRMCTQAGVDEDESVYHDHIVMDFKRL